MGTSNIGSISGEDYLSAGNATNVVTDFVRITGESRSKNIKFISEITQAYRAEFFKASKIVKNNLSQFSKIKFHSEREYLNAQLIYINSIIKRKEIGYKKMVEINNKIMRN